MLSKGRHPLNPNKAVPILKAEFFYGVYKISGVFFGCIGVDAVPEVHDVVAPSSVAENLLRTLLTHVDNKRNEGNGRVLKRQESQYTVDGKT